MSFKPASQWQEKLAVQKGMGAHYRLPKGLSQGPGWLREERTLKRKSSDSGYAGFKDQRVCVRNVWILLSVMDGKLGREII
jgi:hypothetical protein